MRWASITVSNPSKRGINPDDYIESLGNGIAVGLKPLKTGHQSGLDEEPDPVRRLESLKPLKTGHQSGPKYMFMAQIWNKSQTPQNGASIRTD